MTRSSNLALSDLRQASDLFAALQVGINGPVARVSPEVPPPLPMAA
jgi:hypothetical protein